MVIRDPRAILQAGARPLLPPPGVLPGAPTPGVPGAAPGVASAPPPLGAGLAMRPDLQPRPPVDPRAAVESPGNPGPADAPPPSPELQAQEAAVRAREEAFRKQREAQMQAELYKIVDLAKAEAAENDRDPNYPAWYDPDDYPKPKAYAAVEQVRKDHNRHQHLLMRMAEDLDTIDMRSVGVFRNFDKRVESPFYDPTLAADTHMTASIMGTAEVYYDAVARKQEDQEEAEAKEAALNYWRRCEENEHAEAGNADLGIDEARMLLVYGRIYKRILLNPNAESYDHPFITHLLDPATCFPTYESQRGMRTFTRYYTMRVADIVGTFGGDAEASERLRTKLIESREHPGRSEESTLNVMEYWDRRWYGVLVDGDWIHGPIEHKYGCVPIVEQLGPLGRSRFTRSPWGNGTTRPHADVSGAFSYNTDEELADNGLSYVHFMRMPHRQREALLGRFYTEAAKQINPPVLVYQDDLMFRKGPPRISSAEGARNRLVRGREDIQPFPTAPSPQVVNPLMAVLAENYAKWGLSPASYGLAENAGQTGTAIESLTDADSVKFSAFLRAKERFHRREAEFKLKLLKNFGWMVGSEGQRGEYTVPKAKPLQEKYAFVVLTHGMLRRTGIQVDVRLTSVKMANLGPLGNAVNLWRNAGLMTKEEALKLRDVRDPEATLRKIRIEEVQDMDFFKKAEVLDALKREGNWSLYYEVQAQIAAEKGGGGGGGNQPMAPGGTGAPGGAPPGMAPPAGGSPVAIQGASLPQYGMPAGTQGGRPPGGGPPPGMI
jgi:hypothetical protein